MRVIPNWNFWNPFFFIKKLRNLFLFIKNFWKLFLLYQKWHFLNKNFTKSHGNHLWSQRRFERPKNFKYTIKKFHKSFTGSRSPMKMRLEKQQRSDVQLSETSVSRHHGRHNWGPSGIPKTITALSYCGVKGGPLIGPPLYREMRVSRTTDVNVSSVDEHNMFSDELINKMQIEMLIEKC